MTAFGPLFCTLALLASVAGPAVGRTTLERAGPWEAYFTVNEDGIALCGVSQFSEPYGFMLKYSLGEAYVHLSKTGWSVPASARMTLSFLVDGREVWTGWFKGTEMPKLIEGTFPRPDDAIRFIRTFAWGRRMVIRFNEGTEAPWIADLTGTLRVSRAFLGCALQLDDRRKPTQPHRSLPPAPSQPFEPVDRPPSAPGRSM